MANTLKKIQTITVGSGGASSIEFTNIPQTYTDLKVVVSGRGDFTGTREKYTLTFNGSSTGYTYRRLAGYDSGSVLSDTGLGPQATGNTTTASVFASAEYYIPNYTSANNKSWSADSVTENNSSTAWIVDLNAGLWSNSAAITSVKIIIQGPQNFVQYSTATLYGISNANTTVGGSGKATGGNQVYTDGTYWYHVFTSDGNFVPSTSMNVDYLVVAGGGGGGCLNGGGGGAGGMRCTVTATGGGGSLESALAVTAQTYAITVGAGGAGSTSSSARGTSGSNSVFSTITSTGGGGGASDGSGNGLTGGSGGGASNLGTVGTGTANQGYAGGTSTSSGGGGGGGAGAVGANAAGSSTGGAGGTGVATFIGHQTNSTTYAGGGGGGGRSNGSGGSGGTGGGASGGSGGAGNAGTANTGGGGGGGGYNVGTGVPGNGGAGGSGIVIVRYAA